MNGNSLVGALIAGLLLSKSLSGSMGKVRSWSAEEDMLLGTMSDKELSEKLGISRTAVFNRRLAFDPPIPAYEPNPDLWTPNNLSLLGTMSDYDASVILGVSRKTIYKKRRDSIPSIPAYNPKYSNHVDYDYLDDLWDDDTFALLGSMSDPDVAMLLGVTPQYIYRVRKRNGIAAYDKHDDLWTPESIDLLGNMTDEDVAKILNVHRLVVLRKRQSFNPRIPAYDPMADIWTPERISRLGKVEDKILAGEMGIHSDTVSKKRNEFDPPIPAYNTSLDIWTPGNMARLGTVSDPVLAAELGVPVRTVAYKRLTADPPIESYRKRKSRLIREERARRAQIERQSRTIDQSLNMGLIQGEGFRTRDTDLIKGRGPIPSDVNTSYRSPNKMKSKADIGMRTFFVSDQQSEED